MSGLSEAKQSQIGYTFPKTLISRMGLDNLRVYVQGQDLLMITPYTGIDPEMENYQTGVDYNGSPQRK